MQFIDLNRQYELIGEKINNGLKEVLNHKRFIVGPEVKALEKRLAEYVGRKHAVCCASGTDALTISLMALEIEKNDAVFVPSFTFFASAESITLAGGTPVFVDCREDTFNISLESLENAIDNVKSQGELNPKGIIAVDLFGQPAEHAEIKRIADKNEMFVLEDGAQGFGGEIDGKRACSFGDVSTTSFFPAKPLGCYGDGGAIFTDDDNLAALISSIHIHGQGSDKYDNVRLGLNSRLDTMQAVVLDAKLDIFDNELKLRNKVAEKYISELKGYIETPIVLDDYLSSWAQFTLKAQDEKSRQTIIKALNEQGIPTAVYYPVPIHKSTAYKRKVKEYVKLPNTENLSSIVFSIPMHPYLTDDEIEKICEIIKAAV